MAYYGLYEDGKNGDWVDLVTLEAGLASTVILIQNRELGGNCQVVFGGSKPTDPQAGINLGLNEVIWGSGAAVWVRSPEGFKVAVQDKE